MWFGLELGFDPDPDLVREWVREVPNRGRDGRRRRGGRGRLGFEEDVEVEEEEEGKAVALEVMEVAPPKDRKGTAKLNVLDDGTLGFFDTDKREVVAAGCAGGGGGREGGGGGSLF